MTTCTRFAPSPTGYLHIGSVRTALFCWLYAKNTKGKFILRIEDTDRERSTEKAVEVILDGMQWLGLDWDEGPIYQTKRFDRYKEVIDQLLEKGLAYKCYCSKERLDKVRENLINQKQKAKYDGKCRSLLGSDLPEGNKSYVVRFKNPLDGNVEFIDKICGKVITANSELDDWIMSRTDGTPTYNFTVVVDDLDMGVTTVIRGADHLANTPKQVNLLQALIGKVPIYCHIPMILGDDGKKLSKRHGAISVLEYKTQGYLPKAILNYLVRLGWSHQDQEIFSMEEMIEFFGLDKIQKSAAAFNTEKLQWLNQHYIKKSEFTEVEQILKDQFRDHNINLSHGPELKSIFEVQKDRVKTLKELTEKSKIFYIDHLSKSDLDQESYIKHITIETKEVLKTFIEKLEPISDQDWQKEKLHQIIKDLATEKGLKMGNVAQPIRVAVTGGTTSPSIDITLQLIGKQKVLDRLNQVIIEER